MCVDFYTYEFGECQARMRDGARCERTELSKPNKILGFYSRAKRFVRSVLFCQNN